MSALSLLVNPRVWPEPKGGRVVRLLKMDEKVVTLEAGELPSEALAADVAAQLEQLAREKEARRAEKRKAKNAKSRRKRKVRRLTQHDLVESGLKARPGMDIHALAIVTGISHHQLSVILAQLKNQGRVRNERTDKTGKPIFPAKWFATALDDVQGVC
jgi:acid stress-induced BolA-like protein IbaG/YrbA